MDVLSLTSPPPSYGGGQGGGRPQRRISKFERGYPPPSYGGGNKRQFNLSVSTSTISASSSAVISISSWSTTATPSRALAVMGLPSPPRTSILPRAGTRYAGLPSSFWRVVWPAFKLPANSAPSA